ncbi:MULTISPECIES: MurR/RpiR family transcriptional regulator [unclassified Brachybacterium]|uniref:MurR/RpiR family transcriptional regulator n=1 Tax=unclassified Brachybacterium TaxID=2623841 RepID=UPI000C7F8C54|nr:MULTISPECIES: MurR/RpiR family transcriptional regulator [unclassified Brachybacterium]PMC75965.1 RpiR family transcriptional regulator [Brachybacterium sp. UMB0905]
MNILTRINGLLPELRPAERRVADAILADPGAVARDTITALADRCSTSAPTVVRFSRRLGFSGYPQLRLQLAKDVGMMEAQQEEEIPEDPEQPLLGVVARIRSANVQAVQETAGTLDLAALQRAAAAVVEARRITLLGIGGSGVASLDLYQKLTRLGLPAARVSERHEALTVLALERPSDVVIAISDSGGTVDVIEPAKLAAERGATVIAITNHPASMLADLAEVVLVTASRESALRPSAMASRTAQLMAVDCLFAAITAIDPQATDEALDASFRAIARL